jgi:type VI secretion system secreted protein Hcp
MAEMFLQLEGVKGESLDEVQPPHKEEIEIRSWIWNCSAVVKWDRNQGGQTLSSKYEKITIEKTVDRASAVLMKCCLTGKHIPSGKITCRKKDGESKVEYLIVDLRDIVVSKVDWSGGGGIDDVVGEKIDLEIAEFYMHYKLQQDTGDASGATDFGFNIQTQIVK